MTEATVLSGPAPSSVRFASPIWSKRAFGVRLTLFRGWPLISLHREGEGAFVYHAREELKRLRGGSEEPDEMQDWMDRQLLRVVRTFADGGHSGFSASYAVSCLEKLLRYEPLTPLTGDDDEWMDVGEYGDGPGTCFQNRRCSRVFKNGRDAPAYAIDGRVFIDPEGCSYTGSGSKVEVTFPYVPTIEYVQVDAEGKPVEPIQ